MKRSASELTSFFFQAEDGIRDFHVTGVQTCALPIFPRRPLGGGDRGGNSARSWRQPGGGGGRSEERRVGKECRSRRKLDAEQRHRAAADHKIDERIRAQPIGAVNGRVGRLPE